MESGREKSGSEVRQGLADRTEEILSALRAFDSRVEARFASIESRVDRVARTESQQSASAEHLEQSTQAILSAVLEMRIASVESNANLDIHMSTLSRVESRLARLEAFIANLRSSSEQGPQSAITPKRRARSQTTPAMTPVAVQSKVEDNVFKSSDGVGKLGVDAVQAQARDNVQAAPLNGAERSCSAEGPKQVRFT